MGSEMCIRDRPIPPSPQPQPITTSTQVLNQSQPNRQMERSADINKSGHSIKKSSQPKKTIRGQLRKIRKTITNNKTTPPTKKTIFFRRFVPHDLDSSVTSSAQPTTSSSSNVIRMSPKGMSKLLEYAQVIPDGRTDYSIAPGGSPSNTIKAFENKTTNIPTLSLIHI